MQGGGGKIDDSGVPIAEYAPHLKYRGRRQAWVWQTPGVQDESGVLSSLVDSARKNVFRNSYPSYQAHNAYETVANKGTNQNYIRFAGAGTHHEVTTETGPGQWTTSTVHTPSWHHIYGTHIFKNVDFHPNVSNISEWAGIPLVGNPSPSDYQWEIVFPKGRALMATNGTWADEPYGPPADFMGITNDDGTWAPVYGGDAMLGEGYSFTVVPTPGIDAPSRDEYFYIGVTPMWSYPATSYSDGTPTFDNKWWTAATAQADITWTGESQWTTSGVEEGTEDHDSALYLYANKWHMHFVLFGPQPGFIFSENDPGHPVATSWDGGLNDVYIVEQAIPHDPHQVDSMLKQSDKDFLNNPDAGGMKRVLFGSTGGSGTGNNFIPDVIPFFRNGTTFLNLNFIASSPYSFTMAGSAGSTDSYLMTAEIKMHQEFVSLPYHTLIVANETIEEKHLPNYYSFLSLLNSRPGNLAEGSNVFNEDWGDTSFGGHNDQLTLGGLINPNQITLIDKEYSDYQAFSQVPPGHANWDIDNGQWKGMPYHNPEQYDYFHSWAMKYSNFLHAETQDLRTMIFNKNLNIVFPYESTKYLVDFNEHITLFPYHVKVEFPCASKPVLPTLLRQAKADKYVMRAIIASVNGWHTNGSTGFSSDEYSVRKEHPPGEKLSGDYFSSIDGSITSPHANMYEPYNRDPALDIFADPLLRDGHASYTGVRTWSLKHILEDFKGATQAFSAFNWFSYQSDLDHAIVDRQKTNYIGIDEVSGWPFNDDLTENNTSTVFTKSIYAHILEKKLQAFAGQQLKSYAQIMNGDSCYSEIIMFRIVKYPLTSTAIGGGKITLAATPGPWDPLASDSAGVQNIWMWNRGNLDNITYLDTQVKPGKLYKYGVYAYHLVVGNEYTYDSDISKLPEIMAPDGSGLGKKLLKEIKITNTPVLKIVEVPYYGWEEMSNMYTYISDNPPVPPDPVFIPYRNVSDKINITIRTNTGEYSTNKLITLLDKDIVTWENIMASQNIINPSFSAPSSGPSAWTPSSPVTFKSDTHPALYEVFRIGPDPETDRTSAPSSYDDFYNKLHKVIQLDGSSVSFDDEIKANSTYYYIFRSRDFGPGIGTLEHASAGAISNPTSVFKVEMVKEVGKTVVYPMITIYDMGETYTHRATSKTMKRLLNIKPAYEHILVDDQATGYVGIESAKSSNTKWMSPGVDAASWPVAPVLGVSQESYELFHFVPKNGNKFSPTGENLAKRFKIRLTSRSSGRKIDINVGFLHKHDE